MVGMVLTSVIKPALPAMAAVAAVKQALIAFAVPQSLSLLYLPMAWGLSLAAAWLAAPLPGLKLRTLMRSA